MMSPVENPMIISKWLDALVTWFTSWHRQCAFVKRIFVRYSFYEEELVSH